MEEQHRLAVQEDGVDVLVGARRLLGAGRHFEGTEEASNLGKQEISNWVFLNVWWMFGIKI